MPDDVAYCLRCDNVFRASSKRPRCPQCKAINGVRVFIIEDLTRVLQHARSCTTFAHPYLFESSTISEDGTGSAPSDSSAPREERVEDSTQNPPTAAMEHRDVPSSPLPPPSFLDKRVNLDSVERMFWSASVHAFTLEGQREWLREQLRHAFLFRVTNADLDSIREKFLERGPPEAR